MFWSYIANYIYKNGCRYTSLLDITIHKTTRQITLVFFSKLIDYLIEGVYFPKIVILIDPDP